MSACFRAISEERESCPDERLEEDSDQGTRKVLPQPVPHETLVEGEVGYVVTGIRDVAEIKIGDTLTLAESAAEEMLPGYKEVRPMVFSGLYPIDTSDYEKLKKSVGKLRLNDAAFTFQSETSVALGFGFRCGFSDCCTWRSSGAAPQGIRYRFDIDLSQRGLPGAPDRRRSS